MQSLSCKRINWREFVQAGNKLVQILVAIIKIKPGMHLKIWLEQ